MLKKQYVKSRKVAKITFELPKGELPEGIEVESIHLVGDFNDWDHSATPMVRRKGGIYKATVEVEPGQAYQFRYLVNGEQWCNDWHADGYVPSGFDGDNCVVVAPTAASVTSATSRTTICMSMALTACWRPGATAYGWASPIPTPARCTCPATKTFWCWT